MRLNRTSFQAFDKSKKQLVGCLISFSLLTVGMYAKGYVRVGTIQLYAATLSTLLLAAVLYQQILAFKPALKVTVQALVFLALFTPFWSTLRELWFLYKIHASIEQVAISRLRGNMSPFRKNWCATDLTVTHPLCFFIDDGRMEATEYIVAHTSASDRLFSGLPRHDKVFANDDLIYFSTGRLPATRWSHFDPDLQTRADIQLEMIKDLQASRPPYIVLYSEFEAMQPEPNDSSLSSGVHLLDDYIRGSYTKVETFGYFSIWQKRSGAAS